MKKMIRKCEGIFSVNIVKGMASECIAWMVQGFALHLTWKEFRIVMTAPIAIVGIWILFSLFFIIPNDIVRTIAI